MERAAVFDSLLDVISSSPWTYAVVFLFAFGDVLFPVIPSETAVITAGVLSASGDLDVAIVIVCAACGAVLGDNTAYLIGRHLQDFVRGRLFRGRKRRHLDRAESMLSERGGYLIVIGRFIPGGRTAVTFAAGVLRFPWRRFIRYDVAAGILWACYGALLGYFGGKAFEESPAKGLFLALGLAFAVAASVEGYRWWRRRRLRVREAAHPAPVSEPVPGDGVDRG
jgi:membrane protein DedA with SNARE-associated domain